MKVFYDDDADLSYIQGKRVAILGYGSQGHAHAQNLRDSGVDVVVGTRPGISRDRAERDGFAAMSVEDAVAGADITMVLLPDERQRSVYESSVRDRLRPGSALAFAHGFNIHFKQITPPASVDVFMVAPKAPGHLVRREVVKGAGVPALLAVHQDASGHAQAVGLAYARALGCTRAGVIPTTFAEETETDLFGEQTVLCGGVTHLVQAGFETLVEAGYQPEVAYFECMNELKLIVDLMYEGGIRWMRHSISDTAQYGDLTRGPRVIDAHVKENMRQVLKEIRSGEFAREWILDNLAGRPVFNLTNEVESSHPIEAVGRELRSLFSWMKAQADAAEAEMAGKR